MAATGRDFLVGVAGVVSGLVVAFIGAYGNHLGVATTIEHQNEAQQEQLAEEQERQQDQFDEERSRTIAEQREDVYLEYLQAADTSFHASQRVALAELYCEGEPNDVLTCDQDDAEYLAYIDKKSDAIVAYRDMETKSMSTAPTRRLISLRKSDCYLKITSGFPRIQIHLANILASRKTSLQWFVKKYLQ